MEGAPVEADDDAERGKLTLDLELRLHVFYTQTACTRSLALFRSKARSVEAALDAAVATH